VFSHYSKRKKLQEYIEQENHSYPGVFENSPDILLFVMDVKGVIVSLRGPIVELLGVDKNEIIGKKYKRFIYKEDLEKVEGYMESVLNGNKQYAKYRIIDRKGSVVPIDVTLTPIKVANNEVIGFYGLTHNISIEQQLEQKNVELQDKFHSLIHNVQEIITVMDSKGRVTFQSPSLESILGYRMEEIDGENLFELVHAEDRERAIKKFDDLLTRPNTPYTIELRLKHKNGQWRHFRINYTNLLDAPSVNGIVCHFNDITEVKKQENEIRYMAYHDYLTALPNRRAFKDRLDLEMRLALIDKRKFAVFIFNLDGFKFLNDTYGHHIGDLLLIEVARKVDRELYRDIEIVARIGGDEFAILMTNIQTNEQVHAVAERISNVFEDVFHVEDYQLYLSASIGISIYPESGEEAGELIKNAGLAVYRSKKAGHQKYHIYSPTANIETYKQFTLRNDLRHAFHKKQFQVYYQPIVHGETNEIVALEALLRWDHPDWGMVSPNEFIPIAEESGLIIQMGEWVLKQVCEKLRSLHDAGYMVKASVNLSPIQFLQTNLLDMITSTLQENGLKPEWLTLEITETVMLEQTEEVLHKVEQIRASGIHIALDDFGDGYASFRSLKEVKPDFLKIDRSLVKEIPSDQDSIEMVSAIIQLAHRMSIAVVAEGVETKEQRAFLMERKCERLQGYLFSRPVPEENVIQVLEKTENQGSNQPNFKERRAYFRIDFPYPLEAAMTIAELNGKKVQLGRTKVLIENIGAGGLRFLSSIKLPNNPNIILEFQVPIDGENIVFYGRIVHASDLDELNRYGIQFFMDEQEREALIERLNKLQIQLRNNPLLPDYPFITENIFAYFNRL
jgi:diguanylate cyclase (GGDEF)-like protein/PAS domain S-box-containing protein